MSQSSINNSVLVISNVFGLVVISIIFEIVQEKKSTESLTPEEHLLHVAVRHILHRIEVLVVGGNLDDALPACGTDYYNPDFFKPPSYLIFSYLRNLNHISSCLY